MSISMRIRKWWGVAALGCGCLALIGGNAVAGDTSRAPLLDFWTGIPIADGGTSKITRTDSGVSMQVRANQLNPGDAYTLWMVVFNYPENCAVPYECLEPDIENPAVATDVMYVAGNVVGATGISGFAGHKAIGDNSGSVFPPLFPPGVNPPGLLNPMGSEIHLIVHTHGPMIPDYMPDMIQTFGGGCVDPGPPFTGLWFPEWGAQGPNNCLSQQVGVHRVTP